MDADPTWVSRAHETCHHQLYKLTCADYEALLARAGECCEICGKHASTQYNGKLVIDHAHRQPVGYAAVRGLICKTCNRAMGRYDSGFPARHVNLEMSRADAYCAYAWYLRGTVTTR